MGDLYERLRRIREQQRRGATLPGGSGSSPPEGPVTLRRKSVTGGAPGPGWEERAPGVFYRSLPGELPRSHACQVSPDGRWRSISAVFGVGEICSPLFLDVETSGLSGGSGSVAFLTGLGRFVGTKDGEDDRPRLRVEQLFLADLGAETAYTGELHRLIGDNPCYVTYNGASFDIPVLRTRAIMTRRNLPEARHLDLLPITRRLFSPVIGSCRLSAVEERVLGVQRDEDIPGSQVPERYQEYLRRGDPRGIAPVLAHHFYDILHLALLAVHLNGLFCCRTPSSATGETTDLSSGCQETLPVVADEAARLRLLWERGSPSDRDRAAFRVRHLLACPGSSSGRAREKLAELQIRIARSRKDWPGQEAALRLLHRYRGSREDAVALAKFLEHRQGRFDEALQVVSAAADRWGRDASLEHRMARLLRKKARYDGPSRISPG